MCNSAADEHRVRVCSHQPGSTEAGRLFMVWGRRHRLTACIPLPCRPSGPSCRPGEIKDAADRSAGRCGLIYEDPLQLTGPHRLSCVGFRWGDEIHTVPTAQTVYRGVSWRYRLLLTLWRPLDAAIKHPVPDRVKPSFVIFDIRALWRSALSFRVPECQKLQMTA